MQQDGAAQRGKLGRARFALHRPLRAGHPSESFARSVADAVYAGSVQSAQPPRQKCARARRRGMRVLCTQGLCGARTSFFLRSLLSSMMFWCTPSLAPLRACTPPRAPQAPAEQHRGSAQTPCSGAGCGARPGRATAGPFAAPVEAGGKEAGSDHQPTLVRSAANVHAVENGAV